MFNLLPESIKDVIRKEYRLRLFIIILSFIVAVQISFLVFLFPSWLISSYKENDFLVRSDEANRAIVSLDIASTTESIRLLNEKTVLLDSLLEYPKVIPLINTLISLKTSSIRFNSINYVSEGKNNASLSIEGISDRRDSLVSFSDSLRNDPIFKEVDLPISNLAKDRNIEFNITVKIEI